MEKENINPYNKKTEGIVKKITKQTATIQKDQFRYYPKYERYTKTTIKIHARIPQELIGKIKIGQTAIIAECRPLSKTVRHVVVGSKIEKVKNKERSK
jgi:small subunit ribosomal protein S17